MSNGNNRRASSPNDGQEPGPSKRRRVPPPEYYHYYSDSDSETEFDAEKHQHVLEEYPDPDDPEDYRRRLVELSCRVTQIAEQSPDVTRNELMCALGSFIPGLPTDLRMLLEGPWDITPTDVPGLAEPAAFWQRDVEEAIRAQTSASSVRLDLFIGGAPFMRLNNRKLTSWAVLGRVSEGTKPPGEPFVLSVFSGSEAPTPHVLLLTL